ncbi:type II secretion system protein [Candidatus Desantisbacteria bacterium]|nr:type II secretion system protein [Candidatus Desantisbacteria bacterium]
MKGFTLIEILAASGILAVLAILIHGSFNISASIWKERQEYMEQEQDARISMKILRQKISCAYLSPWHKETGFEDRQGEIKFKAATNKGISRVMIYLKQNTKDEKCLWMDETIGTKTTNTQLCAGVNIFEVDWLQDEFPQLVRVRLGLKDMNMPEMIVPVRVEK